MKERLFRKLMWLALTVSGATVYQVGFTGANGAFDNCGRFAGNGLLTPIDFCYILDCQSGFLGGAIQPCGDPTTTADDILVDCPGGGTTTGTTTG